MYCKNVNLNYIVLIEYNNNYILNTRVPTSGSVALHKTTGNYSNHLTTAPQTAFQTQVRPYFHFHDF